MQPTISTKGNGNEREDARYTEWQVMRELESLRRSGNAGPDAKYIEWLGLVVRLLPVMRPDVKFDDIDQTALRVAWNQGNTAHYFVGNGPVILSQNRPAQHVQPRSVNTPTKPSPEDDILFGASSEHRNLTGVGVFMLVAGIIVGAISFSKVSEGGGPGFNLGAMGVDTFPSFALVAGVFVLAVGFIMMMVGIATDNRK